MEFLIPFVLLLVIVGGAVAFFVLTVTRKSNPNAQDGGTPSFGRDDTPLGDTSQHAGQQNEEGETVAPTDAQGRAGGTGAPVGGYASTGHAGTQRGDAGDAGDDDDVRPEPPATESERLADRER